MYANLFQKLIERIRRANGSLGLLASALLGQSISSSQIRRPATACRSASPRPFDQLVAIEKILVAQVRTGLRDAQGQQQQENRGRPTGSTARAETAARETIAITVNKVASLPSGLLQDARYLFNVCDRRHATKRGAGDRPDRSPATQARGHFELACSDGADLAGFIRPARRESPPRHHFPRYARRGRLRRVSAGGRTFVAAPRSGWPRSQIIPLPAAGGC
jgi:hypothetical protein